MFVVWALLGGAALAAIALYIAAVVAIVADCRESAKIAESYKRY